MTIEEEIREYVAKALGENIPFEDQEKVIAEIHHRYGRKILPPISGRLNLTGISNKL